MPKEITHWLIAEQVFLALDDRLPIKQIIKKFRHCYQLGAVLPDSPLYVKWGCDAGIMLQLGKNIHDAADSFTFLKKHLQGKRSLDDPAIALMLGMIAHLHADSTFHPFVSFHAGPDTARHFHLETYMDLFFLPDNNSVSQYLFKEAVAGAIQESAELTKTIQEIFSATLPVRFAAIKKMLYSHALIQDQFHKTSTLTALSFFNLLPGVNLDDYLALFYPFRKPVSKKLFPREYTFLHPVTGTPLRLHLDQLLHQTVEAVIGSFSLLNDRENFITRLLDIPGTNANTGIFGKYAKDMSYFSEERDLNRIIF